MGSRTQTSSRLSTSTYRLRAWIYLVTILSTWIAMLGPLGRNQARTETTQQPETVAATASPVVAATTAIKEQNQSGSLKPSPDDKRLPTIQEIRLDKDVVCRGEQNFVSVRATGADGTDAHLRISLSGTQDSGPRIPFRVYDVFAPSQAPKILVEGRGGAEVEAALPPLQVKDCDEPKIAEIVVQTVGTSSDEWTFTGRIVRGEFVPQSYEWNFGDGTSATTKEPFVMHSFRFRNQDKRYSSFLLSLTMYDSRGARLNAERAVGMSNPAFGLLQRHGKVAVFGRRLDDAGTIQLYHAHHAPADLARVEVRLRTPGTANEQAIGSFSAVELLGVHRLIPGEPETVHPEISKIALPARRPLTIVFELFGMSTDGMPVTGTFSTVIPE